MLGDEKASPGNSYYNKNSKFGSSVRTNGSESPSMMFGTKKIHTWKWRGSLTKAPDGLNRLPSRKTERNN